jgi:hypothetical protein
LLSISQHKDRKDEGIGLPSRKGGMKRKKNEMKISCHEVAG